ncbi:ATP-binding SpoIIE family protein phosphatase [Streptomyces melanosporofaciens]|uniref:PAS domain S-box-containing protein n=1 Tax=Streptomyces melanosporofaciens TaxID=67327 RepID=A0A1H4KJG6_STRMJ|nr:SpoIIE family protein phosphatase [Streptomyces melanosporofaciens]SEB58651.1 PAS domain S-box-containing protein [Streptomyces melanosporofaciens]
MTESGASFSQFLPGPLGSPHDTAAVVVTDAEGRVTHWSSGAQSLLGYALEEILGRPLADIFTADGAALRHRDGHSLDAQVLMSPLQGSERQGGFLFTAVPGASVEQPGPDELMRWMFDQNPVALSIVDCEGRALRQNQKVAWLIDYREQEIRGRLMAEFLEDRKFEEPQQRALRVAATGQPEFIENFVKFSSEPTAHAWAVDIFPLKDSTGRVRAVGMAAHDYSELYGSRERLALLSEARTRIGTSLDVADTARELAEVAMPRFADMVSVDLLGAVFEGDLPASALPGPVVLRRAALAPCDRTDVGVALRHPASSPLARCLATGQAELHHISDPEVVRWFADDPAQAAQARVYGIHSLIAVPIRARGTTLGAALFLRGGHTPEPFTANDLVITEDLVARASICLDNARRFARERGIALGLQRALLPQSPSVHPAVETAARYLPAGGEAEVGGDWFDVIALPGARVGLVVGDVVGHGIRASATMGRLRTAVRTLADVDLPPDELLTHLDDIVTHTADRDSDAPGGIPSDVGAGCLYAIYDPVSGSCSLARAGHPAPVLVHPDGTTHMVDIPAGPPLGLGSLPFEATELTLPAGSVLALFTDGLIETRDADVGDRLDTLCHALSQPAPSLDALCDSVLGALHTDSGARTDDIALLVARTRVLDEHQVACWDLPRDPAVVAETRKQVGDRLTAWGLKEAAFTTELVVSELVTNAIRYATGPIRLQLIKEQSLICEVCDGSSTSPHLRRARPNDEGGRGLFLVAQLTERWGTRYTSTGKIIWAEQPIGKP